MNCVFRKTLLAALATLGLFMAASSECQAWYNWNSCLNWECPERYKIVNCYTKCAWKRTWHGPNALATPLRQYYIPRPPACCWYSDGANTCGCAAEGCYDSFDYLKCQCQNDNTARPEIVVDASTGFSPPQFQRLGEVRNELDVAGAAVAPSARQAAPAR